MTLNRSLHHPNTCTFEPCSDCIDEPRFDPSDYERPVLPPVLREPEPVIHLAQIARYVGPGVHFESWCGLGTGRGLETVAFDPRVATCERCKRALHEAVSQ